jgi:hypothetical protein
MIHLIVSSALAGSPMHAIVADGSKIYFADPAEHAVYLIDGAEPTLVGQLPKRGKPLVNLHIDDDGGLYAGSGRRIWRIDGPDIAIRAPEDDPRFDGVTLVDQRADGATVISPDRLRWELRTEEDGLVVREGTTPEWLPFRALSLAPDSTVWTASDIQLLVYPTTGPVSEQERPHKVGWVAGLEVAPDGSVYLLEVLWGDALCLSRMRSGRWETVYGQCS